jgi:hypothetical protein
MLLNLLLKVHQNLLVTIAAPVPQGKEGRITNGKPSCAISFPRI